MQPGRIALFLLSSMWVCGTARAALIFESATSGPEGITSGAGQFVNSNLYSGQRFRLTQRVDVTSVGAHLFQGSGQVFGALVRTRNQETFPNQLDLTGSEVVGTT